MASGACGGGGDAIIKQIQPHKDDLLPPSPLSNTVDAHWRVAPGPCTGCNSIVELTSRQTPPSLTTSEEHFESCDGGEGSCNSIIDSTPSWENKATEVQVAPVASCECCGGNDGVGCDGTVGGGDEGGGRAVLRDPPVSSVYGQKVFRPIQPAALSPTRSFWALEQPQVLA